MSVKDFDWLPKLQEALNQDGAVIAYAQGEPLSGLLGLVACVRREPGKIYFFGYCSLCIRKVVQVGTTPGWSFCQIYLQNLMCFIRFIKNS